MKKTSLSIYNQAETGKIIENDIHVIIKQVTSGSLLIKHITMLSENKKPKTIEEYILAAPPAVQQKLWQMHDSIAEAAPGAVQDIKWNMPAYSYKKILVAFAVFKNHIGFYPMGAPLQAFEKELENYKVSKVAVQFPLAEPLPVSLIKKIVVFRVQEEEAGTIKWRS